jgi:uncharacterized protein YndB with AHSA1/START domain
MNETKYALKITFPNDREMVSTRSFNAPRDLVFEALTSCEHLKNWWGPRRMVMASCEMDFIEGGKYRFVHRDTDGSEYAFRGEFLEIVRPERVVQTFEFELMAGHISRETMVLTEENGVTTLTGHSIYSSAEDMKGHVDSGMESGMVETYDRLEELLSKRQETGSW